MTLRIKKSGDAVIRVVIRRQKEKARQFTLVDAPLADVVNEIKTVLKPKADCFGSGLVTSLLIFREKDGKRTEDRDWISFRGLTVDETFELLTQNNNQ